MTTDRLNFTSKDQRWHAWRGQASFLLSDEEWKVLTSYKTPDDMVNALWQCGFQVVAVELNQHIKDSK